MKFSKPLIHGVIPAIMALLLLSADCKKKVVIDDNGYLIPLKVGNTWKYTDSTVNTSNGQAQFLRTYDDKINTTEQVAGQTYYIFSYRLRNIDKNTVEVAKPNGDIRIFLKKVSVVTTVYTDTISSFEPLIRKLVAYPGIFIINGHGCIKNEEQVTSAGVLVEKRVFYVRPGLGVVKFEMYLDGVHLSEKQELISYSLK